jgi:hypothetical protein
MTAPKVGDRVHVEFDGEVVGWSKDVPTQILVGFDGNAHRVAPSVCTVIVPPVRVGDKLTLDDASRLPHGSVVALVGGLARTLHAMNGQRYWRSTGLGGEWPDEDMVDAIVLRVGDGS